MPMITRVHNFIRIMKILENWARSIFRCTSSKLLLGKRQTARYSYLYKVVACSFLNEIMGWAKKYIEKYRFCERLLKYKIKETPCIVLEFYLQNAVATLWKTKLENWNSKPETRKLQLKKRDSKSKTWKSKTKKRNWRKTSKNEPGYNKTQNKSLQKRN